MNKKEHDSIVRKAQRIRLSSKLFLKRDLFSIESTFEIDSLDDMTQYRYFIDNVETLEELHIGLSQLSPFADDALEVVRTMTEEDFIEFKKAVKHEREIAEIGGGASIVRPDHTPILLPDKFFEAILLSEKARAPLGITLVRILQVTGS